jgi:uncharacterized protein (TIGR03382 family)
MRLLALSAAVFLAAACAADATAPAPAAPPAGPVARSVWLAGAEAGVPGDLMLAVAAQEGGLLLPPTRLPDPDDAVPVAGALELRRGKLDTLALGARLMNATEDQLRADTALGTRAGARVLAELGRETGADRDRLETWAPALERLSGLDDADARVYAQDVIDLLRKGGDVPAWRGERVHIPAHREIPEPAVRVKRSAVETPDFPGAIWFTTSCTNKCTVGRPDGNASVDTIVIHDTEGGWNASVATLQNDSGKSVHYIVDADGSRVGQFRHETDTTWHAGNYFYNKHSVGIEHVGYVSDPGFQTGLYNTSESLVASIRTRWNVPLDRGHIIGHYQVPNGNNIPESSPPCGDAIDSCETNVNYGGASHHTDPGVHWQWCQYMEHLGGSCTCNDAYDHFNCTTDLTEAVRCVNGNVEIAHCDGPAGCTVQPVGVDDTCDTGTPAMPDAGVDPGAPDASPIDPGAPDAGAGNPDNPEGTFHVNGGCQASGHGGGGVWALLLGAVLLVGARRRRRG